jgi:hypothetical protein
MSLVVNVRTKGAKRFDSLHGYTRNHVYYISGKKLVSRESKSDGKSAATPPKARHGSAPEDDASYSTAEKVLCDLLFAAKKLIYKARTAGSGLESDRAAQFMTERSREEVEEDISKVIVKLIDVAGPNRQHRMTAYAQVGEGMLSEMESVVFNDNSRKLKQLQIDYDALKTRSDQMHRELTQSIATRDIEIAKLKDQRLICDSKLKDMSETNTTLQLELEKLLRDRIQTHQNSVELRMQGLDFKAEVNRRCGNILTSVQSRMGFVPVGIEKQVELLRLLKVCNCN